MSLEPLVLRGVEFLEYECSPRPKELEDSSDSWIMYGPRIRRYEAARVLRVSPQTINNLSHNGLIRQTYRCRVRWYSAEDVALLAVKGRPGGQPKKSNPMRQDGAAIRRIRKARGWTLERLASETGLTTNTLSLTEREKTGCREESLLQIARALRVPNEVVRRSARPDGEQGK